MIYTGVPLADVPPYVEGTRPVPFLFFVLGTSLPTTIQGYNFGNADKSSFGDSLYAGIVISAVRFGDEEEDILVEEDVPPYESGFPPPKFKFQVFDSDPAEVLTGYNLTNATLLVGSSVIMVPSAMHGYLLSDGLELQEDEAVTLLPVTLMGYNLSDQRLSAGAPVTLVTDMFQQLIYAKSGGGDLVQYAQKGIVEEAVVSTPYRDYFPVFISVNREGELFSRYVVSANPHYVHHLSSGTFRLLGKTYVPIQATYYGNEHYLDSEGLLAWRNRGELKFDWYGRPVYLLGRRLCRDDKWFALHQDFFLKQNGGPFDAFLRDLRTDSPFLSEYVDGRECNFDIKPIALYGAFPEEWELTLDATQAQFNYDFCVVPEAADGECFVKGEELCFRRRVSMVKVPVFDQGRPVLGEWQWGGYTYYEAVPYDFYYEPLRGQGKTESLGTEYVRLKLYGSTGLPDMYNEEKVCRLCEYSPSRGVFYKIDADGIRFPVMTTPDTSEGYGVATAVAHTSYDEVTHECIEVIEHECHPIVRSGHELMLNLEQDCWRQCGNINGTVPPDLGDPRVLPRRVIFIAVPPP